MRNILLKEIKLSASILSFLFILFGFMFFLPGYPILCGAFFVTLGIYQGFLNAREANDIVFSALLPISKSDVVKGKYIFVCFIESCGILLMLIAALIRMTVLVDSVVYRSNAMMNANLFALGAAFVIFGLFNVIFLGGFFRTAHNLGKPFVIYIIAGFLCIGVFEALHFIPALNAVNAFGFDEIGVQLGGLIGGMVLFLVMTFLSFKTSCKNFEKVDL